MVAEQTVTFRQKSQETGQSAAGALACCVSFPVLDIRKFSQRGPVMPSKRSPVSRPAPTTDIRLLDLMLRVGVAVMAFVAGAWWALDRIVAEKILTCLAMPTGIIWLLLLVAALAARRARRSDLLLAIALPWAVISILGNSYFVDALSRTLEDPYRNIDPLQSEPMEAVVVLGGGTSKGGNGRVQVNTSGDRVVLAAEMYHAGLTKTLICTGRRITQLTPGEGQDPGEQSKLILLALGIPEDDIELLDGRNTSEEMRFLGERFRDSAGIGLITSAWHLPRATRLAKKNGFDPIPLPADFISTPNKPATTARLILDCIPQDGSLSTSSKLIKEYLGMLAGR